MPSLDSCVTSVEPFFAESATNTFILSNAHTNRYLPIQVYPLKFAEVHYLVHYLLCKVSGKKASRTSNVTLLLTRGPLGNLVFSRAREIKYAKKTSSLNSVATVKLTLTFRVILELVVVAALVIFFSRSSSTRGQSFFLVSSFRLML